MALETVEDIVSAGVAAQVSIDRHLTLAYKAAAKLVRVTERGVEEGMVQGIAARKSSPMLGLDRAPSQRLPAISPNCILHRPQRALRPAPILGP